MKPNVETNASRDIEIESQREQVAANLAFLIVQAHRRGISNVDKSTKVSADSDS